MDEWTDIFKDSAYFWEAPDSIEINELHTFRLFLINLDKPHQMSLVGRKRNVNQQNYQQPAPLQQAKISNKITTTYSAETM